MPSFVIGRIEAGMASLITAEHFMVELPVSLLPYGVIEGSVVDVTIERNLVEEENRRRSLLELESQILTDVNALLDSVPRNRPLSGPRATLLRPSSDRGSDTYSDYRESNSGHYAADNGSVASGSLPTDPSSARNRTSPANRRHTTNPHPRRQHRQQHVPLPTASGGSSRDTSSAAQQPSGPSPPHRREHGAGVGAGGGNVVVSSDGAEVLRDEKVEIITNRHRPPPLSMMGGATSHHGGGGSAGGSPPAGDHTGSSGHPVPTAMGLRSDHSVHSLMSERGGEADGERDQPSSIKTD